LLLITTEFDRWELRQQRVADRLDALLDVDLAGAVSALGEQPYGRVRETGSMPGRT
jgi:hypothetical protein